MPLIYLKLPALLIVAIPLWIAWRFWRNRKRGSFSWHREVAYAAPFIYALAVIYFAFFPLRVPLGGSHPPVARPLNLWPAAESVRAFNTSPWRGMFHLGGNILMFMPFGILAPWLSRRLRAFGPTVSAAFRLSIAVEVVQYIIGGHVSDVDDVILNTIGAALGFGVYWAGSRLLAKRSPKQNLVG